MAPSEPGPTPAPPAVFREVGPSVEDWEKYLRKVSDDLEKQRSSTDISSKTIKEEDKLFLQVDHLFPKCANVCIASKSHHTQISICVCARYLQTEDSSVRQLQGEFQTVISALRSKLDSRAAPPVLHLDTANLQTESPRSAPFFISSTGAPVHTGPSPSSQESRQPWSLLAALMNEIQNLRTREVTEDESQTESSSNTDASVDIKWSATSEDFAFVENGDRTELKSSMSPLTVQSTTVSQPVTEGARTETPADKRQPGQAVKALSLHRKYRSLLRKRQIPGASGKST